MEKEKSSEIEDSEDNDYIGYSEKQTDLDVELQAGKWHKVKLLHSGKQNKNVQFSRDDILSVYHIVSERLNFLITLYCRSQDGDPQKAEQLINELQIFRSAHDAILNNLVWGQKDGFRKELLPKEVWDFCGI